MNASDKVLVDTSAWIDYFRLVEPCHSIVARLLAEGRVCSIGLILAELMQGAKSEKELNVLRDFVHVFNFLPDSPETWQAAGELSFNLRRSGKTIGLSDCFIAVAAQRWKRLHIEQRHSFRDDKAICRNQAVREITAGVL